MLNLKDILRVTEQIAEEKGIKKERVLDAIESSLASAYKKEFGSRGEVVRAELNKKTGDAKFWQVKTVVDETMVDMTPVEEHEDGSVPAEHSEEHREHKEDEDAEERTPRFNESRHILLDEAKKIKKDVQLEDELSLPLPSQSNFGRIAAQTAKQMILQKIREAERESIIDEFQDKEGEVVSGTVQRFERGNVYIDLGRAVGVMFHNESIFNEHYQIGERLKFYVLAVQEDTKLPGIILSRSHPKFVSKLFEMEVPEIADGIVEVKMLAREPGSRTKIAVGSTEGGVDPVGSCVGQRGTRVMAVNNELGQEKIDIIEWSEEPEEFIANSLSPAHVESVEMIERREARVYVAEDQLSLAIGKGGQNVRLAAKLTGWKIDVRSHSRPEEVQEGGVAEARLPASTDGEVESDIQEIKEGSAEEATPEAQTDVAVQKKGEKSDKENKDVA